MVRLNLNKKYANYDKDVQELMVELEDIATKFCAEEYAIAFDIPLKLNGRLTRALGRFVYWNSGRCQIELAKDLIEKYDLSDIIDVLKHELIHFCLWKLQLPHDDGHPYFEEELKRLGVSATKTNECRRDKHIHKCDCCGEVFVESRKLKQDKWYHKKCKGKGYINYVETVSFNHKVVLEYIAGK